MAARMSKLVFTLAAAAAASDAAVEGVCGAAGAGACAGSDHVLLQLNKAKVGQASWPGTGRFEAEDQWCRGEVPAAAWSLQRCGSRAAPRPLQVKVLTYNLFWWNLFGIRGGEDGRAGRLIAEHQAEGENQTMVYYDLMVFQECDDVNRILQDARNAGLSGEYAAVPGAHALGIVYRSSSWTLLEHGTDDVAEDHESQWYGNRGAQWARLQHKSGKKNVTLVNHHGPLPVNTGGRCGGKATAYNLLHTIGTHMRDGDAVVLAGDFNAANASETVPALDDRLHRVFTGESMGGIDHIWSSSCTGAGRRLGLGGSDHEALDAQITI